MISFRQQWEHFRSMLISSEMESCENEDFYIAIINWLLNKKRMFEKSLWDIYDLDYFTAIQPYKYATEYIEVSVKDLVDRLQNFTPSSADSVLMIIRDILWDLIAFKTTKQCPNCGDDDLRVLAELGVNKVIFSCDLCCWSEEESGKEWSGSSKLIVADKDLLLNKNLIKER